MEEYSKDSFSNRDEAVPVITFEDAAPSESTSGTSTPDRKKGKRERLREHGSHLKDKLTGRHTSDGGTSMQDRLLEK